MHSIDALTLGLLILFAIGAASAGSLYLFTELWEWRYGKWAIGILIAVSFLIVGWLLGNQFLK